ncbi:cupin domain-containing protein [Mycobacterium sp. CVI_P3]|uniref:Cupin domain-containing protein n=1 Tax=Mycobacterium pinniadriaticum TaxID=2994102 RepID=A0ABT3SL35_9MYCO|nr:cupin domain-containing protein [Mycobacterium pinniadriaticum]MCX2933774.1 cupin domain-containing protein [Mycobacterium pinniadriaticum]MCX2940196.1 cupin domain-containing protein [Mycobacterium pinniadriaticum]
MTTTPEMPKIPDDEKVVSELASAIDPDNLRSLVFPLSNYQQFDDRMPTVVLGYLTGQIGMCVWNLEPGQQNDYHVHPTTEHMHIVIEGECEYSLGDAEPVIIRVGDAVMVPAGIAHGIRNISDKRTSYVAVTSPGPYEKIRVERPQRG